MGLTVIVAEKPSMGESIAKALGIDGKKKGYFEDGNQVVTWAVGHLMREKYPEEYDEKYKKWDLWRGDFIFKPERFEVVPSDGTKDQLKIVVGFLKKASLVINAGDAGQEGERIQRLIYEHAGYKGEIKRLWTADLTSDGIKKAFADLRPSKEYDNLFMAAQTRSQVDWLYGFNLSRMFTVRLSPDDTLSLGRIQTPVLAAIVRRNEAVKQFKVETFYRLLCQFEGLEMEHDRRFKTQKEALESITQAGKKVVITDVKKEVQRIAPPRLYNKDALQADAAKLYKMSMEKSYKIADGLYNDGYISYFRTDSRYLPERYFPVEINEIFNTFGLKTPLRIAMSHETKMDKRIFDDSKIEDHHAILPLRKFDGGGDEKKIYDLVLRQLEASFAPDFVAEKINVEAKVGELLFKGVITNLQEIGWKGIIKDKEDEEQKPSKKKVVLSKGQEGIGMMEVKEGKTTPPKNFTETTLKALLINPKDDVSEELFEDDELESNFKVGTAATRDSFLKSLYEMGYVTNVKGLLIPTPKGEKLIKIIPSEKFKSLLNTAKLEKQLSLIRKGEVKPALIIQQILEEIKSMSDDLKAPKVESKNWGICPCCGQGNMMEQQKYLECDNLPECGYKQWHTQSGCDYKLSEQDHLELIKNGKTTEPKEVTFTKSKKKGKVILQVEKEEKRVSWVFDNSEGGEKTDAKSIGKCPRCGTGEVVKKGKEGKFYGCNQWKKDDENSCQFSMWTNFFDVKLTEKQITQLLAGKEVTIKQKNKTGDKEYDQALRLNVETGKYEKVSKE